MKKISWPKGVNVCQGIEKPVASKMLEKGSNRTAFAVDKHAGIVSFAAYFS